MGSAAPGTRLPWKPPAAAHLQGQTGNEMPVVTCTMIESDPFSASHITGGWQVAGLHSVVSILVFQLTSPPRRRCSCVIYPKSCHTPAARLLRIARRVKRLAHTAATAADTSSGRSTGTLGTLSYSPAPDMPSKQQQQQLGQSACDCIMLLTGLHLNLPAAQSVSRVRSEDSTLTAGNQTAQETSGCRQGVTT
jgi:hypothetical protein